MEKLLQIRVGYPAHTTEHRMADEEIRRREAEEARKAAERSAQIDARRHEEEIALSREEIDASHYSNRLAAFAIAVAVVALVVAILGWMFPREPRATGRAGLVNPQLPVAVLSNTAPAVSLRLNSASTSNPAAPPKTQP